MQGLWLALLLSDSAFGSLLRRREAPDTAPSPEECPELAELRAVCRRGRVQVLVNTSAPNQRVLQFGDECTAQSRIDCKGPLPDGESQCAGGCGACPCEFDAAGKPSSPYIELLDKQLAPWCSSAARPSRLLSIGLGGGELVQRLLHRCPKMKIDAVEYSADVINVARKFFGVGHAQKSYHGRLALEKADAWQAVRRKKKNTYDVVLIDCFAEGGRVPKSCRSPALAKKVRSILTPSGIMLQHMWHKSEGHPEVSKEFRKTVHLYVSVFHGSLQTLPVPMPVGERVNDILRASKKKGRVHTAKELIKDVDARENEEKKNMDMLKDAMAPLEGMMSDDEKKIMDMALGR